MGSGQRKNSEEQQRCRQFFLLFRQMQTKVSKQELELWATTTWAIWNARNKMIFEQFQTHPKVILEGAMGLLEEYQSLMETQRID